MAIVAMHTDVGTRKPINEDACCVEAAQTPLGEVIFAVICDGVGGYTSGEVASATVISAFSQWFEQDLPLLIDGMSSRGTFDFSAVRAIWDSMLFDLNRTIRAYGSASKTLLGTTFSGIVVCAGHYLVGHVGDCRVLKVTVDGVEQLTEDQTLGAKLAAEQAQSGKQPTADEAAQSHVILQSVGTQRVLRPAYYEGSVDPQDVIVLLCDGAWKKPGNDGVAHCFRGSASTEANLHSACESLVAACIDLGESDNISVAAFALGDDPSGVGVEPTRIDLVEVSEPDGATTVFSEEAGNDSPTLVYEDEAGNDSLTMVFDEEAGNDSPTLVFEGGDE